MMASMQTLPEKIKQRRAQMLIHSHIYYRLNDSIVSDHTWQRWADELVQLHAQHPDPIGFYDHAFDSWDGSTGYHLPCDEWIKAKADVLLFRTSREQRKLRSEVLSDANT